MHVPRSPTSRIKTLALQASKGQVESVIGQQPSSTRRYVAINRCQKWNLFIAKEVGGVAALSRRVILNTKDIAAVEISARADLVKANGKTDECTQENQRKR